MAVPKKKTSHQKQAQRRARYLQAAQPESLTTCPNCSQPARPHQICISCGYYRGRPARRRDSLVSE